MLGGGLRRPWIWGLKMICYGGDGIDEIPGPQGWKRWKRLVLVGWWAGNIVAAVGGWQNRLVRARRIRIASSPTGGKKDEGVGSAGVTGKVGVGASSTTTGKVGAELAREEKRVHASLNIRRKFFHALAVLMFVPGIAIDVCIFSIFHFFSLSLPVHCSCCLLPYNYSQHSLHWRFLWRSLYSPSLNTHVISLFTQ